MKITVLLSVVAGMSLLPWTALSKPAPAEIVLKGKRTAETGYVVKAQAGKVYFSASPTGKNAVPYSESLISRLTFKEPEGWAEAEKARLTKDFAAAEKLYEQIAVDYRDVAPLEDNYGSLARLNQLECLRNLGEYRKLARARPNLKKTSLSDSYHAQIDLYVGWASLASLKTEREIEQLENLIKGFREKELTGNQLAQAFYLSAMANEKAGKSDAALTDYHRAFTLDFGEDRDLAKMAMESALKLYAAVYKIEKDRQRLQEAHGLASIYKSVFGEVPSEAAQFDKPLPPLEADEG